MVKPPGRVQGADCPGNHLGFSPLSTSRVVRGLGARSGRELDHPHLRKLFIRHLFFLVNLVHLVAIGLIEVGDRLTLKFFRGVRHLLKRQKSMKFMQIKWQTLRHTWAGVMRACLDIGGEALGDKAALSTTASALLVLDDRKPDSQRLNETSDKLERRGATMPSRWNVAES